jgi:hypothetical protein
VGSRASAEGVSSFLAAAIQSEAKVAKGMGKIWGGVIAGSDRTHMLERER